MRSFSYFLYENFDAEKEAENPKNPRRLFSPETDRVLTWILNREKEANEGECRSEFGESLVDSLIEAGFLGRTEQILRINAPFFLSEDLPLIRKFLGKSASEITDLLEKSLSDIFVACKKIRNNFPVQHNLYHILCGMVLDGSFFDFLSQRGIVKTSNIHPSGLDYLLILYEQSETLRIYSEELLCSYNRLADQHAALQSFGDADGNRHDFYRFFRLWQEQRLPEAWASDRVFLEKTCFDKDTILSETVSFIKTGDASPTIKELLERFGYAENGKISVPVYLPEDRPHIRHIAETTEQIIGESVSKQLLKISESLPIRSNEHGVDPREIANELYHLLFGEINRELIRRKIATAPPFHPGEGRYLKSVEIYE